jgi:cephalosporin hydroxylase
MSGRSQRCRPKVSVIVVTYNIPREAPRTLLSLAATYQRHIHADDYEVIVVDNGSTSPIDSRIFDHLEGNFRLIRIDAAPPSPAYAVNRGIAEANGEIIGVMVDGARIVTPGLIHFALRGAKLFKGAVVATLGWYLGYDLQRWSMQCGYDQQREDALLNEIRWPQDGYRLFEIATLDESSVDGWIQPIAESNALFMRRGLWESLGGMDERFDLPGGGYVNLDTFARALELPDAQLVVLLGEGTFHQLHGGVATNLAPEQVLQSQTTWAQQYEAIRGRPYRKPSPSNPSTYVGTLPRIVLSRFVRSALAPVRPDAEAPLGRDFDPRLWLQGHPELPADPAVAAAITLAQREFRLGRYATVASIARLIRSRAPEAREPRRLLSLTAGALEQEYPIETTREHFQALADAYRLLGESQLATSTYQKALATDRALVPAPARDASCSNDLAMPCIGSYFPDRDQPPLSSEEVELVGQFHQLYYQQWLSRGGDTNNLSWLGHQIVKCPLDLWIYQELLVRTRPDVVIETGTWYGGSALFMAMIQDLIGHGQVITIDTEPKPNRPRHPRVVYFTGSSVDKAIIGLVGEAVGTGRAMVVLDSDHRTAHVYDEIIAYSPFVQVGDYLIVEDTNINGHPVFPDFGPGPMEALEQFLADNDEFTIDKRCERFLMSLNPKGYLRRTKPMKTKSITLQNKASSRD